MSRFGPPSDSLFGMDGNEGQGRPALSIDEDFREFDRAHPEVFRLFAKYAEDIRSRGFDRYSADAILHRIRWWHHIERGDRDFAVNNNYSSRYARLLMDTDDRFAGFFETRVLRSERSEA